MYATALAQRQTLMTKLLTQTHSYGWASMLCLRQHHLLLAVSNEPVDLLGQLHYPGRCSRLDLGSQHRLLSLFAPILGHSAHRQDA